MKSGPEHTLAVFLTWGTWIAAAGLLVGLILEVSTPGTGLQMINGSIALIIALPLVRIYILGRWYFMNRMMKYGVLSVVTLLVIIYGIIAFS